MPCTFWRRSSIPEMTSSWASGPGGWRKRAFTGRCTDCGEMLQAQTDNPCAAHVTLSDKAEEPTTKTFTVSGDIMYTAWVEVEAENEEDALRAGGWAV